MRVKRARRPRIQPNEVRAAQYIRVSTASQSCSAASQAAAIANYAKLQGFVVVRTYQDDGKSGLHLKGMPALKQLIADAQHRRCDFKAVLVYDVSRWGRFQDTDESAYYEFACKAAGIPVLYCTEQTENDGGLMAALIKTLKRVMAAEYSRELSTKVFAGHCRLANLGYWQGGVLGYGFQRLLVDATRRPKCLLGSREYKGLVSDRVILVPGPPDEVAVVRRIYSLFSIKRQSAAAIARILNAEGVPYRDGRLWRYENVYLILRNEKYVGNNVYNRKSRKLRRTTIKNPTDMWIRSAGCFQPIIQTEIFEKAARLIEARKQRLGNKEYLLQCLRTLLAKEGRLSARLINTSKLCPAASTYKRQFGSLPSAYKQIGYTQLSVPQLLPRRKGGRFGKFSRPPRHCAPVGA